MRRTLGDIFLKNLNLFYILLINIVMKKTFIILITVTAILLIGAFYFFNKEPAGQKQEQVLLEQTYGISKEYLSLRLQTDNVLVNAKSYPDYESWNTEMTKIISDWNNLEKKSQELQKSALEIAELSVVRFDLIPTANAYTAKEISDIYDGAPKFKGIATLASHLGVDAKRAQVILDKAQAEISSGVFTEEGDAFENLENTAIVVKDGCKVAGFVGGIVLTGGVAGFAAAGTMAQVGTVVVGVDLALEVTEDGAQIAFGDKNKVSSFVKDIRTVTEPIANIITITNIPSNLGNAYGKFESVMVGLEKFRETAQEGKVIGVNLNNFKYQPSFQLIKKTKYPGTLTIAEMEKAEVEEWLKSLNKKQEPMSQEEIKKFLTSSSKPTEQENKKNETAENIEKENNEVKLMSVEEFEELFDNEVAFESVSKAKKIFGEPDEVNILEDGYGNYVYRKRLVYPNGIIAKFTIRFHNKDVEGYSIGLEE
jgi:hypothetical protein